MEKVFFTARFLDIPKANLEEFKQLAHEALADVKPGSGTLGYNWFFNAGETECVVLETYQDSAAVTRHATDMNELLPKMISLASGFAFECYGNPTPELVKAIQAEDQVFRYFGGLEE